MAAPVAISEVVDDGTSLTLQSSELTQLAEIVLAAFN